jgi:hypothetical protein
MGLGAKYFIRFDFTSIVANRFWIVSNATNRMTNNKFNILIIAYAITWVA